MQRKNNWRLALDDYHSLTQDEVRLDRRDPGPGYRHLINLKQLRQFIGMLPDWAEVAAGLDAIVLVGGSDCMGWYERGVVAVCAWERELWWENASPAFVDEHRLVFDLLGVARSPRGTTVQVRWTECQARAFQLLHILPHELGHHRDRITTRSQQRGARGEPYAERYADEVLESVWPHYREAFEL